MSETAQEKAQRETKERMERLGGVWNPIVCDIPEEAWEPVGDFDEDENGQIIDARTKLKVCMRFAGIMMHVEAIEVYEVEEGPEAGFLKATNPYLEVDVERIWAIAGWEGDSPDLLEVQGRQYLLTMFPFA